MAMFKRILLPLDLTDKHKPALDIAAELAGAGKGEVTLLHVIELIPGLSRQEEKPFYDRLERAAREHVERNGKLLTGRGITWHGEVCFGTRAPEIARRAAQGG